MSLVAAGLGKEIGAGRLGQVSKLCCCSWFIDDFSRIIHSVVYYATLRGRTEFIESIGCWLLQLRFMVKVYNGCYYCGRFKF